MVPMEEQKKRRTRRKFADEYKTRGIGRSSGLWPVGRNTIKKILKEQGIDPAPLRRRQYFVPTIGSSGTIRGSRTS